jgi:carboxypeptidase Taq
MTELTYIKQVLSEVRDFEYAANCLSFQQMTDCPPKAREKTGDIAVSLKLNAFKMQKDPRFQEAVVLLHKNREQLDEWDRTLSDHLYRTWLLPFLKKGRDQ